MLVLSDVRCHLAVPVAGEPGVLWSSDCPMPLCPRRAFRQENDFIATYLARWRVRITSDGRCATAIWCQQQEGPAPRPPPCRSLAVPPCGAASGPPLPPLPTHHFTALTSVRTSVALNISMWGGSPSQQDHGCPHFQWDTSSIGGAAEGACCSDSMAFGQPPTGQGGHNARHEGQDCPNVGCTRGMHPSCQLHAAGQHSPT